MSFKNTAKLPDKQTSSAASDLPHNSAAATPGALSGTDPLPPPNAAAGTSLSAEQTELNRLLTALERKTAFLDKSPAALLHINGEGRVVQYNATARWLFARDLAGSPLVDLLPCCDREVLAGIEGNDTARIEQKLDDKVLLCTIKKDESSNSYYLYASDITTYKNVEEALGESEEKYRNLVERASDGIVILQDTVVKYANPRMAEMIGYEIAEAIDRQFSDFIHPDELRKVAARYKLRMAGKDVDPKYETALRHKNGKRIDAELNVGLIRYQDSPAELVVVRDITERKAVEKALQESEEKYRMVVENANEAILILQDNKFKFFNSKITELSGYTEGELQAKLFADFIHPSDREMIQQRHAQRLKGEILENVYDFRIIDKAGNIKWVQINSVLISWEGRPAALAFLTDVTAQYRSRQQLVQSDKLAAIGTLAAGVAHEINNPIGYVNSNLNTMQKYIAKIGRYIEGISAQDQQELAAIQEIIADFKDALAESIEGTSRVKNIVADLKSFSRSDQNEKKFADLNEGINSTLNIVWNELKYKCTVEKELADLPDVFCVPNQLNQVFMNLLINAGHAIENKPGVIKIKTWVDDNIVHISIKDNGSGIPEDNLKKIFEPFFTTKEVGKGTGLGLSLAFDIIKKHNGNIDVTSEVGVGTEFIISVPIDGGGDGDV